MVKNKMKMFLKSIKEGMLFFADLISNFINNVLLVFAYFTVLALTAIFARIVSKRFLSMKIDNWSNVNQKKEINDYFRQF